MKRALLAALALAACAAPVRAQTAAEALSPLIGCWRGTFENQPNIEDERCFQVLGEHVVDTHHVRATSYTGEATYHLNDATGEIVFAYASNDGARSNGAVRVEGAQFVFPLHLHRSVDGTEKRLRATWTVVAPDRFVTVTEHVVDGAWRHFMRITYVRAPDLAPPQ